MKNQINQILKDLFLKQFSNAKKMADAETQQGSPFRIMERKYANGMVTNKYICLN